MVIVEPNVLDSTSSTRQKIQYMNRVTIKVQVKLLSVSLLLKSEPSTRKSNTLHLLSPHLTKPLIPPDVLLISSECTSISLRLFGPRKATMGTCSIASQHRLEELQNRVEPVQNRCHVRKLGVKDNYKTNPFIVITHLVFYNFLPRNAPCSIYFSSNMLPYITPGNKKTTQLLHALIKRASEEQIRCILKACPSGIPFF